MTANKRTYEVDRLLTRELCLKYPDNTPPRANLAVLTDGRGGTYYGPLNPSSAVTTGFNEIYLPETKSTIYADLSFNILNFRQGTGMYISKIDHNTIIFQTTAVTPSTYSNVSTPNGIANSDNIAATLTVVPDYGSYVGVKNNNLHIGSYPAFTAIDVDTRVGTSSIYASTILSTLHISPGFGINLQVLNSNTLEIASNFSSYALNQLQLPNQTLDFTKQFNSVKLEALGNLAIRSNPAHPSTVQFETHSFASVSTSRGNIYPDTNNSFRLLEGAGIIFNKFDTNALSINISSNAFARFIIYSTVTAFDTNISNYPRTAWSATSVNSDTSIALTGVAPIRVLPASDSTNLVYVGLDYPALFSGIVSSISTTNIHCPNIDISTLTILDSLALSSHPTKGTFLTVNSISTTYSQTSLATISTLAATTLSAPLIEFDYTNSKVTINPPPSASINTLSLVVHGVILADQYATYSDSSLKNFKSEFEFSQADLEILKPWKFTWKATNVEDMGFAAEDVEKVAPYAVKIGPNGLRMVDYGRLSVVSMAALRETNARLVSVESTLASIVTKLITV